jgi:hypothetical protein
LKIGVLLGSRSGIHGVTYKKGFDLSCVKNAETPQDQEIEAFIMMPSYVPEGGCPLSVIMHGSFGADNQHLYIA